MKNTSTFLLLFVLIVSCTKTPIPSSQQELVSTLALEKVTSTSIPTQTPLATSTPLAGPTETPQVETSKQNGMSFVTWWPGVYSQPDSDISLANLAATGANWVTLIAVGNQESIESTTVTPAFPDEDLIHVIEEAHGLGMRVMLKINLVTAEGTAWAGNIGRSFTDTEWETWFASYQNLIGHYAELSESHGVEQLCLGAELQESESHESNWRALIAHVRERYSGPITYGANWGSENNILWWDAIDYIGVDAYYRLAVNNNPTVDELKMAWQPIVSSLGALSSKWDKPILFTEVGYRSLDGASKDPGNWEITGPSDPQEQADAYQAFFEAVYEQSWFAGIHWWTWTPDPLEGSLCDTEYTPHGKPAENILRQWYGAPPLPDPGPDLTPDESKVLQIYDNVLGPGWENWSWGAPDINLAASEQVVRGTNAIFTTFDGWGAISLHHDPVSTESYYWLEFYVRETIPSGELIAKVNNAQDKELRSRPLYDCRYIEGNATAPGEWKRVRIPLSHLNAEDRQIVRVTIQNWRNTPSALYIDEIRLVGAQLP